MTEKKDYCFCFLTDRLNVDKQNEKSEISKLIDSVAAKMINDSLINSASIATYFDGLNAEWQCKTAKLRLKNKFI